MMKKLTTLLLFCPFIYVAYSRMQAAFNYQAGVMDVRSNTDANRMISLKINILHNNRLSLRPKNMDFN